MTNGEDEVICKKCKYSGPHKLTLTPDSIHYGRLDCGNCGAYIRIEPKPDSDASKYRRPSAHRELVEKYSTGICQSCRYPQDKLPGRQVLEAHHLVPYEAGGSDERDNILILCTGCHRLEHLKRNYFRPPLD